jgi:hypothetical protein
MDMAKKTEEEKLNSEYAKAYNRIHRKKVAAKERVGNIHLTIFAIKNMSESEILERFGCTKQECCKKIKLELEEYKNEENRISKEYTEILGDYITKLMLI